MGGGNAFFMEIKDSKGIKPEEIRRLRTAGDTLFISYTDLIPNDGDFSGKEYRLGFWRYYETLKKSSSEDVLGRNINFYFDRINGLSSVIQSIIEDHAGNNGVTKDSLKNICYRQIFTDIGKPSTLDFNILFEKLYLAKGTIPVNANVYGTGCSISADHTTPVVSSRYTALTRGELPSLYTLRRYAPPVGNQGNTGTCTAWATAYAARSVLYNYAHDMPQGGTGPLTAFSPEYTYFKIRGASNSCENGTSIYTAINVLKEQGDVVTTDNTFNCSRLFSPQDAAVASNFVIKGGESLFGAGVQNNDIVQKVKESIAYRNQPVIIGISIPNYSLSKPFSFQTIRTDGMWQLTPEDYIFLARNNGANGHAMCIIGYNDDPAIMGGAFEVMNSWGAGWANKGYCWISYNDFGKLCNQAYTISDLSQPPAPVIDIPVNPTPPAPPDNKQSFKGSLKFYEVSASGDYLKDMPLGKIERKRSVTVENDESIPDSIIVFKIDRAMNNGGFYKIEYASETASYAYLLSYDGTEVDALFPLAQESPVIDIKNAKLVLPNERSHYTLGNTAATERMCLILSKKEIDVRNIQNNILSKKASQNYYAVIQQMLPGMVTTGETNITKEGLRFNAEAGGDRPLVIFINLSHN